MLRKIGLPFIILAVILPLVLGGCVQIKSKKDTSAIDGGIFKTTNKGRSWHNKSAVLTTGRPTRFSGIDVVSLVMDPSDHKAIYYGSIGHGLFYTYDGAESWQKAYPLRNATIRAIAVDPKDKCTIYVGIGNRVYKSDDCNRSWRQVYIDNEVSATINAIAVDYNNNAVVYIGISRGDLVKSADAAASWQVVKRFKGLITKIVIDSNDNQRFYVITKKKGVFYTPDAGANWEDFNQILKETKFGFNVKDLILVKEKPEVIFLATDKGILKSSDRGVNWQEIKLIPPEKKTSLNALAVNPQNIQEIYYTTNTTFNYSADGGMNWTPFKLPTTRAGWRLLIDPREPNILYMGTRTYRKK